ncbi:MAG: hypothetical protein IKI93_19480 [Clostridia bacterium]|nr:hypothetical protein [Clostridia bacterium]
MFKSLFSQKTKIKGIIGYLGLEDFWLSCSPEEQKTLTKYYQGGLGSNPGDSPVKGDIVSSTDTAFKYLSAMIGWAVSEKKYELADKIIKAGNDLPVHEAELVDAHFFLQEAAECYYKQRDIRADALALTIEFCLKDIQLFPKYIKPLKKEIGCIPRITTFQRLAILYEKNKQYEEAINICRLAIKYDLKDSTKGGYPERLEKLEKKINK